MPDENDSAPSVYTLDMKAFKDAYNKAGVALETLDAHMDHVVSRNPQDSPLRLAMNKLKRIIIICNYADTPSRIEKDIDSLYELIKSDRDGCKVGGVFSELFMILDEHGEVDKVQAIKSILMDFNQSILKSIKRLDEETAELSYQDLIRDKKGIELYKALRQGLPKKDGLPASLKLLKEKIKIRLSQEDMKNEIIKEMKISLRKMAEAMLTDPLPLTEKDITHWGIIEDLRRILESDKDRSDENKIKEVAKYIAENRDDLINFSNGHLFANKTTTGKSMFGPFLRFLNTFPGKDGDPIDHENFLRGFLLMPPKYKAKDGNSARGEMIDCFARMQSMIRNELSQLPANGLLKELRPLTNKKDPMEIVVKAKVIIEKLDSIFKNIGTELNSAALITDVANDIQNNLQDLIAFSAASQALDKKSESFSDFLGNFLERGKHADDHENFLREFIGLPARMEEKRRFVLDVRNVSSQIKSTASARFRELTPRRKTPPKPPH